MNVRIFTLLVGLLALLSLSGAGSSPLHAQTPAMVYGWHPYWIADSATKNYDAQLLTHLAWFSAEVDTASGKFATTHNFQNSAVCSWALANNVKLHLTVTLFGATNNAAVLSNTSKQDTLITQIIAAILARDAHGVCLDFEDVGQAQRSQLVMFVQKLRSALSQKNPALELVMAIPPVDWNKSWNLPALANECTALALMGYDYYWSGSTTAGPIAPLGDEPYNLRTSVNTYLVTGVPRAKLVLALPWYGRTWPVNSDGRKATSTGTATARSYSSIMSLQGALARVYDAPTNSVWFTTNQGGYLQTWFDDSASLASKYDFAVQQQLAGIGMWALGYEGSGGEMWRGIGVYLEKQSTSVHEALPEQSLAQCVLHITKLESGVTVTTQCASILRAFTIDGSLTYQSPLPAGVSKHVLGAQGAIILLVGDSETYLLP